MTAENLGVVFGPALMWNESLEDMARDAKVAAVSLTCRCMYHTRTVPALPTRPIRPSPTRPCARVHATMRLCTHIRRTNTSTHTPHAPLRLDSELQRIPVLIQLMVENADIIWHCVFGIQNEPEVSCLPHMLTEASWHACMAVPIQSGWVMAGEIASTVSTSASGVTVHSSTRDCRVGEGFDGRGTRLRCSYGEVRLGSQA